MEVAHPTAGWEQVGERFYRKTQLYTEVFDVDLDLDNYIVAGAPYGGAIGECSVRTDAVYIISRHFLVGILTGFQLCTAMRANSWPIKRPRS